MDQIFHHLSNNIFFLHSGTTTLNLSSVLTKPQEHFPEDQIRGTRGGQSENASHTPTMSSCSQESFFKSCSHVSSCRVHLQKQWLCGAAHHGCGFMTAVTCYSLCTTGKPYFISCTHGHRTTGERADRNEMGWVLVSKRCMQFCQVFSLDISQMKFLMAGLRQSSQMSPN